MLLVMKCCSHCKAYSVKGNWVNLGRWSDVTLARLGKVPRPAIVPCMHLRAVDVNDAFGASASAKPIQALFHCLCP